MYLLFCSTKQHCHTDGRGGVGGDLCVFPCIYTVSLISALPSLSFFILNVFPSRGGCQALPFSDCWSHFPVTLVPCFLVLSELILIITGLPFR